MQRIQLPYTRKILCSTHVDTIGDPFLRSLQRAVQNKPSAEICCSFRPLPLLLLLVYVSN